jgi:hypothetical protein
MYLRQHFFTTITCFHPKYTCELWRKNHFTNFHQIPNRSFNEKYQKGHKDNQSQIKWLWWVGILWEDFIVWWMGGSCWWPFDMVHETFTKSGKCVLIGRGLHYSIKGCNHFIISNIQHSSTHNTSKVGNQFTSTFEITWVEVMKQHNQGSLYLNLEVASKSNLKMSILKLHLWHVEFM